MYSLGHRASWSSVAQVGDEHERIEISGDQARVDGFTIGEPTKDPGPTGTILAITVEQGRALGALLRDDLARQLAARLAAHLLGNPDITVPVNGERVDPKPLIEREPVVVPLDDVPESELGGREPPEMMIVDWNDDMRSAPGVLLCTEAGMALIEVDKSAPAGTVRSTGYLRWSGWADDGADLLLAHMQYPTIVGAGVELLARHVADRTGALTATIVTTLKEEGSYPYPDDISDPIEETERQMFDLVAVTARGPLRNATRTQRKLSVQLLKIALQERPESLDLILGEALALTDSERDELAELLRYSSLGAIVGAANEVSRRLDLLATLRHVVYEHDASSAMREVDQLHPLVKDNIWLFGEEWTLSGSEMGLTSVLRDTVGNDVALEQDLVREGAQVLLPGGKRGRVDLLLQRTLIAPDQRRHRLVIELKRPSVAIGDAELTQVKRYARALANNPAAGNSRWEFWLVGATVKDEIEGDLNPLDRDWGHVINAANYDVRVTHWGQLLNDGTTPCLLPRPAALFRDAGGGSRARSSAAPRIAARRPFLIRARGATLDSSRPAEHASAKTRGHGGGEREIQVCRKFATRTPHARTLKSGARSRNQCSPSANIPFRPQYR